MRTFTGQLAILSPLLPALLLPAEASAASRVWNRFIDGAMSGADAGN